MHCCYGSTCHTQIPIARQRSAVGIQRDWKSGIRNLVIVIQPCSPWPAPVILSRTVARFLGGSLNALFKFRTDNLPSNNFCAKCGNALAKDCARCKAENPPISDFCGKCGASLGESLAVQPAAPPEPAPTAAPAGERRHLTVLFCDLVGSTPLSQQLDAEEWREVIAQYQLAAAGAVERLRGYVAKNLGDGLLIYFGWPTAREDDPERAVRAGLAILDAMVPLNATLAADDGTVWRCGLASTLGRW